MRTVTIYCDRCRKAYKPDSKEQNNRNLKLMDYEEDEYDICPECYMRLEKWFDEPGEGGVYDFGRN